MSTILEENGEGLGRPCSSNSSRMIGASAPIPESKEEWDDFVTKYTLGKFISADFSARPAGSTPPQIAIKDINLDSNPHNLDVDPSSSSSMGTMTPNPISTTSTVLPRLTSQRSETPPVYQTDFAEPNPETVPISGPSNQDPDIPDVPASDEEDPIVNHVRRRSSGWEKGEVGKGPQQLNLANMGELEEQQRVVEEKAHEADDEEPSGPSRKTKNHANRRRPQYAALAARERRSNSGDSDLEVEDGDADQAPTTRPSRPSMSARDSYRSRRSRSPVESRIYTGNPIDQAILESGTNTTSSASYPEMLNDHMEDRSRIRAYYEKHGFMPAPRQSAEATRRRLRVIRRLGLHQPADYQKKPLNRFTRLAVSIFKTSGSIVSVISGNKQIFLAGVGLDVDNTEIELEAAFCTHTILGTGESCNVIPNTAEDWRFRSNPLAVDGGPIQFYAGAPLKVGTGPKAAIIGSMCIFDDKPRKEGMTLAEQTLLIDLADCVVSELELLYSQQAAADSAKLHQISVDFLRRSLKHRPNERAGSSKNRNSATTSSSGKRITGADGSTSDEEIDIYDEACREIRLALEAYAVTVVDLSQFHLFYPTYQSSSTAGSSSRGPLSSRTGSRSHPLSASTARYTPYSQNTSTIGPSTDDGQGAYEREAYAKPADIRKERSTYATNDPLAPSRTPQVLFVPSKQTGKHRGGQNENLAVLGYSCEYDGFVFNFASTPAARKIVSDFIAKNVKTRQVWYTRDDDQGIAQSITQLMPPGTETSLAMPVFDFDGQVAFAIVACWKDPLYSYPAGSLQFVETIAGSLLASVMKEKLYQAERAQLSFAAAASHELRTPLHQINAAAALLRSTIQSSLGNDLSGDISQSVSNLRLAQERRGGSPPGQDRESMKEDRIEALTQLEIIEANGLSLGHILENIIDTLDVGRMASKLAQTTDPEKVVAKEAEKNEQGSVDFGDLLESVLNQNLELEKKIRRIAGAPGLDNVEVILEVIPRTRGGWFLSSDPGPLTRALGKIIHNSCKFTNSGYIHITVQDVSRGIVLPAGYDNSIRTSVVAIDIKDTGRGMTADFLDREILKPFSKADPFMPGSGLGLGLAQRMIELLGGKLAIASDIGKGTSVHVEIPLHVLNFDNDSDQENMANEAEAISAGSGGAAALNDMPFDSMPVRQDGILLAGFAEGERALRRVGRSLLRQVKLNFARVVDDIKFARLLVIPEGTLTQDQLVELVNHAKAGLEIIVLTPSNDNVDPTILGSGNYDNFQDYPKLRNRGILSITKVSRPLTPSVLRRILKPADRPTPPRELYVSDVVGGGENSTSPISPRTSPAPLPSPFTEEVDTDVEVTASDAESESGSDDGDDDNDDHNDVENKKSVNRNNTSAKAASTPSFIISNLSSKNSGKSREKEIHSLLRPELHETASDPLPAVDNAHAERPSVGQMRSEMKTQRELNDSVVKVLVVEDNAVNRKILTTMLRRTTCRYAEAVDGADAVVTFRTFAPDLVLLDINMPIKDGYQAAKEMRAIEVDQGRPRCRIIAVTAVSNEQQRRKGIAECGIDEWRTKPVPIRELKAEVEKMMTTGESGPVVNSTAE